MTYASDNEVKYAERAGYTVTKDQQVGHTFRKGQRRIWASYATGKPMWMTADLDGRYRNHQAFASLIDAVNRPIVQPAQSDIKAAIEEYDIDSQVADIIRTYSPLDSALHAALYGASQLATSISFDASREIEFLMEWADVRAKLLKKRMK